ncbi:MAG: cobyrinate a,c-diamide synthase [Pseudomonadota bacterium]
MNSCAPGVLMGLMGPPNPPNPVHQERQHAKHHAGRRGVIIAALASGSGKTVLASALMALLRQRGHTVQAAKCGPDYIDPGYHRLATGRDSVTLDTWSMTHARMDQSLDAMPWDALVVEGVMGWRQGARGGVGVSGDGSTASVARLYRLPVALIVGNASAAQVRKVRDDCAPLPVGLIFNRARPGLVHELEGMPVLAQVPTLPELAIAHRHLGLHMAQEQADPVRRIEGMARALARYVDWSAFESLLAPLTTCAPAGPVCVAKPAIPPLGQHIAVAFDEAFCFVYPHGLEGWRHAGAQVSFFSPLAGESPDPDCDAIYLPGGYPELHAGALAARTDLATTLKAHAANGGVIYGECGGFMALGQALIDSGGQRHRLWGLLSGVHTMHETRVALGYRSLTTRRTTPWGASGLRLLGHEFRYSQSTSGGQSWLDARDSCGEVVALESEIKGCVFGSYAHILDQSPG